jgi:hypothetical protein
MQTFAGVLALVGLAAGVTALAILVYVLPYAQYKNPDWMPVLLRLYKPQIIAYFVLLAVALVAFVLATIIGKHSS